jgi:hypothetical protein
MRLHACLISVTHARAMKKPILSKRTLCLIAGVIVAWLSIMAVWAQQSTQPKTPQAHAFAVYSKH